MGNAQIFALKVHPLGIATAFIGQQPVARQGEKAFVGIQVELQLRAFEPVAVADDGDRPCGPGIVALMVKLQPIGLDHGVVAAQFGLALHHRLHTCVAADAVAPHKRGHLLEGFFGQAIDQHAAGPQFHADGHRRGGGARLCGFGHGWCRRSGLCLGGRRAGCGGQPAGDQRTRRHRAQNPSRSPRCTTAHQPQRHLPCAGTGLEEVRACAAGKDGGEMAHL